jgi:hypothetical protein
MQVIARRKFSFEVIGGIVFGSIFLFIDLWFIFSNNPEYLINIAMFSIVALLDLTLGIFNIVVFLKTPKDIIVFDGENLICPDGIFALRDIYKKEGQDPDYEKCIKAIWRNRAGKYTMLRIYFKGKEHVYRYVSHPIKVEMRLIELCERNRIKKTEAQ